MTCRQSRHHHRRRQTPIRRLRGSHRHGSFNITDRQSTDTHTYMPETLHTSHHITSHVCVCGGTYDTCHTSRQRMVISAKQRDRSLSIFGMRPPPPHISQTHTKKEHFNQKTSTRLCKTTQHIDQDLGPTTDVLRGATHEHIHTQQR